MLYLRDIENFKVGDKFWADQGFKTVEYKVEQPPVVTPVSPFKTIKLQVSHQGNHYTKTFSELTPTLARYPGDKDSPLPVNLCGGGVLL